MTHAGRVFIGALLWLAWYRWEPARIARDARREERQWKRENWN